MVVLNRMDRFSLVNDVIDRVPMLAERAAYAKQAIRDKLQDHKQYIAALRRRHAGDPGLAMGRQRCGSSGRTDTSADNV